MGVKVPVHALALVAEVTEALNMIDELIVLLLMDVEGEELISMDVVRTLVLTLDAIMEDTALVVVVVPTTHCQ